MNHKIYIVVFNHLNIINDNSGGEINFVDILLDMIEQYGATTILSGIAIYLFMFLNKERTVLLNKLDERTQDYMDSLYHITGQMEVMAKQIKDLRNTIKEKK